MFSLLHFHFESAARAVKLTSPGRFEEVRGVYELPAYRHATPAERLMILWHTVVGLAEEDIFTEATFRAIVRDLLGELWSSNVEHADLRIGTSTGRWRWMRCATDGIDLFREELAARGNMSISFLAGVNMYKSEREIEAIFDALDAGLAERIAGIDVNFLAGDLPKFDRYRGTLLNLQTGGLKVNVHLGELFNNHLSRHVLSHIIPDRIGHGVLLLDEPDLVEIVLAHEICLDMCPTSNTLLGVADWRQSSPARRALQLGIPVSINTDDPVLFDTTLQRELDQAGLTDEEVAAVATYSKKYRYAPA